MEAPQDLVARAGALVERLNDPNNTDAGIEFNKLINELRNLPAPVLLNAAELIGEAFRVLDGHGIRAASWLARHPRAVTPGEEAARGAFWAHVHRDLTVAVPA